MKGRRDAFFAIADPSRRAILEKLASERSLSVGAIAGDFELSRNAISKHIIVLKESGLVTTQYVGRENIVSLNAQELAAVYQWVAIFETFWNEKLQRLKSLVESKNQKQNQQI